MNFKRVLVLAPHVDDGEIGCGGSIVKLGSKKIEVFYFAFTSLNIPQLEEELKMACNKLRIKNWEYLNFPVRLFLTVRNEILNRMIYLKKSYCPDLVFLPSFNDIHQDHQVIAQEGLRAFKNTTILGYEEPWNNLSFNTQAFIKLEKKHIDKKVEALKCYKSQAHRKYLNEEFIRSQAKMRGVQIGSEYAEAFEVIRWVI